MDFQIVWCVRFVRVSAFKKYSFWWKNPIFLWPLFSTGVLCIYIYIYKNQYLSLSSFTASLWSLRKTTNPGNYTYIHFIFVILIKKKSWRNIGFTQILISYGDIENKKNPKKMVWHIFEIPVAPSLIKILRSNFFWFKDLNKRFECFYSKYILNHWYGYTKDFFFGNKWCRSYRPPNILDNLIFLLFLFFKK